jgi:diaminohydroxyphosphoribosylaminopyrimidine deaminase/5-amino-6-(5-phosphoribosylamino)uracil reductase
MEGETEWSPLRFVLDRKLKTASQLKRLKLFNDAHLACTVVVCAEGQADRAMYVEQGIQLWELPHPEGRLDWTAFRKRCAGEGIYGVYLEPGPTLSAALIAQQAVDYLFHYYAPLEAGTSSESPDSETGPYNLREKLEESHGPDHLVRGWIH